MKINFTKEHFERLKELLNIMLLKNETVNNQLGMPLNVIDLLHNTSINTLNGIRLSLSKAAEKAESIDEWVSPIVSQEKVDTIKRLRETVNLIIGYHRYQMELSANLNKRKELTEKLNKMKEEAKTPEERIKEVEAELNNLEVPENMSITI